MLFLIWTGIGKRSNRCQALGRDRLRRLIPDEFEKGYDGE